MSRSASSSVVIANCTWDPELLGPPTMPSEVRNETLWLPERAARVNFMVQHSVIIGVKCFTHLLLSLSWYKYHPKMSIFGKPVTLWNCDIFEPSGLHSIIPIQFLQSRAVSVIEKVDSESVLFVCPCVE